MTSRRRSAIILLSFTAQVCIVLSSNVYLNETPEYVIEKCIIDILTSKTQFKSLVTVVNSYAISNRLLQQIHSTNNVNICVKDINVSIEVMPTIYLIHTQNEIEFEDLIVDLDRDWNRRPEALFIVIVKMNYRDYPAEVFRLLWEYHYIHALVIAKDLDNDAFIYTYFPYAEGGCGRDYSNVVMLCDCKSAREVDVVGKMREYDKPVLNNCTFNVATRHYPPLVFCDPEVEGEQIIGVEQYLIEILLETKNISLNYSCSSQTDNIGTILDNFTVTGILNKLYENEVELLFGGFSLNNRRVCFFDYLCSHLAYEDMYVTNTHRSDLVERWRMVYMMFHANVWVLLLLTTVLCAVMLSDFKNLWIMQTNNATISEILNLLGNATQNVTLALRKKLFKDFLIIHWLWFIFLITCFYQTRLTSFTTYRLYKPQLDQYFSLYDYNFTPCIPTDVAAFLENSGKVPIINEEYMKKDNCETSDIALDEVVKTKDTYTVTMYFQYLWWLRNNMKDMERIHLMKESVYNNIYGLFFKRGFPLTHSFNGLMLRLPEHGFVQGAMDRHRLPRQLTSYGANALVKLVKAPLKLEDFTIPFGVLATGTAFSLMALVIEIKHKH